MFQGSEGCILHLGYYCKEIQGGFPGSFTGVSMRSQGCCKRVLRVFQESFTCVSRVCYARLKSFSRQSLHLLEQRGTCFYLGVLVSIFLSRCPFSPKWPKYYIGLKSKPVCGAACVMCYKLSPVDQSEGAIHP